MNSLRGLRTAPHRTAPHRTAPHRTAPLSGAKYKFGTRIILGVLLIITPVFSQENDTTQPTASSDQLISDIAVLKKEIENRAAEIAKERAEITRQTEEITRQIR